MRDIVSIKPTQILCYGITSATAPCAARIRGCPRLLGRWTELLRTAQGRLLALNPTLLFSDFTSGTIICIP